jgi:hypothetical protein
LADVKIPRDEFEARIGAVADLYREEGGRERREVPTAKWFFCRFLSE